MQQRLDDLARFERQIDDAFDYLRELTGIFVPPEDIHDFIRHEDLPKEKVLSQMERIGQAFHFSLRRMTLSEPSFAAQKTRQFFFFKGEELCFLEAFDERRGLAQVKNFATREAETLSVGALFGERKEIEILVYDGEIDSFLATEAHQTPLRNKSDARDGHHRGHYGHHGREIDVKYLLGKLWKLFKEEKKDFFIVLTYAAIVGLMSLVVPLSASAIVNSVMLGLSSQLATLCALVAIGLLFVGAFDVMKRYVADVLQRRIFVRTSFDLAYRLPRMTQAAFKEEYAPEVVNRFFDVLTIQKTIGKFLLDGTGAGLIVLVGLFLLAIYHPFFILFDLALLAFVPVVIFVLGRDGLETSVKESKKKYALVSWFEEIARCQTSFKLFAKPEFIYQRVDSIAINYVQARHKHFLVLARQMVGSAIFRAAATVGVLGLGGALVLNEQLTIGELVAAELVVIAMLGAIEKLIEQFEHHYDLFTAIDKVSHLVDRPLEPSGGEPVPPFNDAATIEFKNVEFGYDSHHKILKGVSLRIEKGARVSLVGASGSGKTTIANLLLGLYEPQRGNILIGDYDISRFSLDSLRKAVGIVLEENEIFDGTIEENITMGRDFSYERIVWALKTAQLYDEVLALPKGLKTRLVAMGQNAPIGLRRRIMFARTIIGKPCVLILDESFGGLEESVKLDLIHALYKEKCWTIIDIAHDAELIRRSEMVYVLKDGKIVESAPPFELALRENTLFEKLFPELARQTREEKEAIDLAVKSVQLNLPKS
ncbi:MAG: ABC transporter ATP-binding protein/permease [Chloroherpetonaceae bacterium]|nr:ABC transporter ATP-binding protein/permease [Chloroherpetonaceae bacterium]MDW8437450.1 ABC transporter ATP-binding protein [Chloroherpetonaceae bacterium]